MVKLWCPVCSKTASGRIKGYYPIDGYRFNFYQQSYGSHIGQYYNSYGWVYEKRGTWHGLIQIARRMTYANVRHTPTQQARRAKFGLAVDAWQALTPELKEGYNQQAEGQPLSGYNLYLGLFMKDLI